MICDGWLEVVVPDEEQAQEMISSVIQLRATWQNLLRLRLEGSKLITTLKIHNEYYATFKKDVCRKSWFEGTRTQSLNLDCLKPEIKSTQLCSQ